MRKYYLAGLIVVLSAFAVFYHYKNKDNLIDLQKRYLIAKTGQEKEKVIKDLEKYYGNLPIPDSIKQDVNLRVDTLLRETKIDFEQSQQEVKDSENIYVMEHRLKQLIEALMISRIQGDEILFNQLMSVARAAADTINNILPSGYWPVFFSQISQYNKKQAICWIHANIAEHLCYKYHENTTTLGIAEKYGALALQRLKCINDLRLHLDIMQRMQYILSTYHGLYDLSVALGQFNFKVARKIFYLLRETGIEYNLARTLYYMGNSHLSLKYYNGIINKLDKYDSIPGINWYKKNSLLMMANVYWQLGQYDYSLVICKQLEKFILSY